MGKELLHEQLSDTDCVIRALEATRIQFYGPLRTPAGHFIFYLRGQIYLESELVHLLKVGKLDNKGLAALSRAIAGQGVEF